MNQEVGKLHTFPQRLTVIVTIIAGKKACMTLILDYDPASQAVKLTAKIDKEIDHSITVPFVAPYLTNIS